MPDSADYLVVGGGIVGLLAARQLRNSGASVAVADAGYPAASASAAGVISALPPWHADARVNHLIELSARRIFRLVFESQNVGLPCQWQRLGMLSLGYPTQKTSGVYTTIKGLAPHVKSTQTRGFWMPEVMQLQSAKLLQGIAKSLRQRGVHFLSGAGQWEINCNAICGWRLPDGGKISAGNYVLCAGAHSGLLCPPPKPPLKPFRGQLLLYRSQKPLICIVLGEDGMYFVPRLDGTLAVGSTFEDVGFDNRPSAAAVADLHRRAAALMPSLTAAQMINAWSGLRPCTPNGVPIIDAHPQYRNLFLNIGHGRYGVAMADGAAQHLQQVIDGYPADNPYAFYEAAAAQ